MALKIKVSTVEGDDIQLGAFLSLTIVFRSLLRFLKNELLWKEQQMHFISDYDAS